MGEHRADDADGSNLADSGGKWLHRDVVKGEASGCRQHARKCDRIVVLERCHDSNSFVTRQSIRSALVLLQKQFHACIKQYF